MHSALLFFTTHQSLKFELTWDHRQNYPKGQPSTKNIFGAGPVWTLQKSKGQLREIRRASWKYLGGTLQPPNKKYMAYELQFVLTSIFCMTNPTKGDFFWAHLKFFLSWPFLGACFLLRITFHLKLFSSKKNSTLQNFESPKKILSPRC